MSPLVRYIYRTRPLCVLLGGPTTAQRLLQPQSIVCVLCCSQRQRHAVIKRVQPERAVLALPHPGA